MVDDLGALRELGVRHVVLEARARDLADMLAIHERFATEVRPRL
jgi:hypothetical protein